MCIISFVWIKIVLPLRLGFEEFNKINRDIMFSDIAVDLIFGIDILLDFLTPLRIGHGKYFLKFLTIFRRIQLFKKKNTQVKTKFVLHNLIDINSANVIV